MRFINYPSLILLMTWLVNPMPVYGQGLGNLFNLDNDQIIDAFSIDEAKQNTSITLGAGFRSKAEYLGSDQTESRVFPYISAVYKGRIFLRTPEGLGIYWTNRKKIRLATSLGPGFGRKADETPQLGEFGKINTYVSLNNNLRYRFTYGTVDMKLRIPLSGQLSGIRLDLLANTRFSPTHQLDIIPGLRMSYHSRGWLNGIYGISQSQIDQSQNPDLAPFRLTGQVSTIGGHCIFLYRFNKHIQLTSALVYNALLGDIKDSPLTPKNDSFTFSFGVSRKFF